ncbi:Aste57867_14598 [Aphanomyces stellatus]|uniref:Aste57867_14598 protein n=1 Tax=Aphanomyces stellatus TaxID=120398 RepID=A0A485L3Q8_9STRA|nr:hypothetical protein As57867_014544 [Aphanomyces stellatus]VFT91417.1 Aste57867_14598 [Aphanomyces stellatus]
MGATKTHQELSPLLESSPATSTSSSSTFEAVGPSVTLIKVVETRSVRVQTKPKEEIYPLPWFRSPDMPKRPIRMVLKKETKSSWFSGWCSSNSTSTSYSTIDAADGGGEKCLHVLVAAILICTVVVILSIIYDSGKKEAAAVGSSTGDLQHPAHFLLRGNS